MHSSHKKNSNKVEGAVPCGNPKRYGSRDVVHMPPFGTCDRKQRNSHEDDTSASEVEKHLQTLLNNQIKTDVTISQQFSQHRSFCLATSHDPEVEKLAGVHDYEKFQAVNNLDSRIDYLRHCGLDDEEITLKLTEEMKDKVPISRGGYGIDPQSKFQKLKEIERKIQEKKELLKVPDTFKGALELSRQALELVKSQDQRQGREASLRNVITTHKKFETTHPDHPVNHIHEMLFDIEGKKVREPRRERRKRRKMEQKQLYYAAFDNDDDVPVNTDDVTVHGSLTNCESYELNPLPCNSSKSGTKSSGSLLSKQSLPIFSTAEVTPDTGEQLVTPSRSQNLFVPDISCSELLPAVVTSERESTKIVKTISTPVNFLCEDEITRNRLSLEEIRAMDKFQNYTEGDPNKVVYVKNLPMKSTEEDLVTLFGSFQSEGKPKIVFKLLTGRMKGQAFLTFPDEQTASKALKLVNGYIFKDRPIILSFGKKQNTQDI